MKCLVRITMAIALAGFGVKETTAIEEASYKVVKKDREFEIRDYEPHILAETVVEGDFEKAGSRAFKMLFQYISGDNRSRSKVAMTAPVAQEPMGEKMKMTSPVGQRRVQEEWVISFMMPGSYTLETLPEPVNPWVTLRQVPARRMATIRYSGVWSEKSYLLHKQKLEAWIHSEGLTRAGDPVWARYNPPFMLWFLRRNEILIPVDKDDSRKNTRPDY